MTVSSEVNRAGPYLGNGSTTVFGFGFKIISDAHLRVILADEAGEESRLAFPGAYTVQGVGSDAGGSITLIPAPSVGQSVTILRDVPFVQETDLENQGAYYAETVEAALDLGVQRDQQLLEVLNRAILLPASEDPETSEPITIASLRQVQALADQVQALVGQANRSYPTRQAMVADVSNIPAGTRVRAAGADYIRDVSATGMNSALWDIGLNGFRADDRPQNAYVAAFHDHNSPRVIRLYTSTDGIAWGLLNTLPLEHDGGIINGGNPVICYRDGWFYMLVSFASLSNYDFRIYKTRDFTSFVGPFNCTAGPTPIASATNPAPGGSVPANEIWGADMSFTPEGVMHVLISVPYGPEKADVRGRLVGDRRMFRTVCTNLETLTFAAPTLEVLPHAHAPRMFQSTTGAIVAPTFPLNHQDAPVAGRAGFEIGFAENFAPAFPLDDLIIVPVGKGGTGFIDNEWRAGGAAYTTAISRIQAVIAANPTAVVEGVLWHQGEADRNNASYQTDLASLIVRMRTDVPALAGKPFIMGEILRAANNLSVDVNAVMGLVSASRVNTAVVSSEGLTDRGDGLHFNSPSYRALGTRYWNAFKTLRGSVGSGGTGVRRIVIIAGQSNSVGATQYEQPSMIDASMTRTPSGWLMNLKDSTQQTLRIYTGASITGPWVFQEGVANSAYAIEGSSIVPRRLSTGAVAWDLYAEGHNTIPDWVSAQQIMVYRGSTALSGWGLITPTWLKSTKGIRHGTPLNLGFEDPAAYQAIQRVTSFAAGGSTATNEQWNELLSGSRSIVPNPGAVYFVTGGDVTNLTILDSVANEFYLAVLSTNNVAGINIVDNGRVLGAAHIGFGMSNNRLVRFVRREDTGRFHAEAGAGRPRFSVNKNGADQVIPAATSTVVTFPNEVVDVGGVFASNSATLPAGAYTIKASVLFSGATTDQTNTLRILRNGTSIARSFGRSAAGNNHLTIAFDVTVNGTDTLTIDLTCPGTGDKTISGATDVTYFQAIPV